MTTPGPIPNPGDPIDPEKRPNPGPHPTPDPDPDDTEESPKRDNDNGDVGKRRQVKSGEDAMKIAVLHDKSAYANRDAMKPGLRRA